SSLRKKDRVCADIHEVVATNRGLRAQVGPSHSPCETSEVQLAVAVTVPAQNGNRIPCAQHVRHFIPIVQSAVHRIVIQQDHRHNPRCGCQDTIHPGDGTAGNMSVTHAHIRTRGTTYEADSTVIKNKFVVSKCSGKTQSATFTPSC